VAVVPSFFEGLTILETAKCQRLPRRIHATNPRRNHDDVVYTAERKPEMKKGFFKACNFV
jgi:hypothetical protein